MSFESLPIYKPDYIHIKCICGGIIGAYDRENLTCEKCGKKYQAHELEYDNLLINDKTGWFFPVKRRY